LGRGIRGTVVVSGIEKLDYLLEINPDYNIVSAVNGVLVVDDWYKNFEELQEFLYNAQPIAWYPVNEDYFDGKYYVVNSCRDFMDNRNYFKLKNEIVKLAKEKCNIDIDIFENGQLDFNYFTLKKEQEEESQIQRPHQDNDDFGIIIYMDKISDGGTAVYDVEVNDKMIFNPEKEQAEFKYNYKLKVNSKPNRLVFIDGRQLHGAYFDNINSYLQQWRITQVYFANHKREQ